MRVCSSQVECSRCRDAEGGRSSTGPGALPGDGLVSLKDIVEDGRLSWEGFDKFGSVQEILDHNKCASLTLTQP